MQTPSTTPCVNPYAMVCSIIGDRDCQSNPIGATIPDPDAGEPGWYITAEPFVILDETPQVADGHLAYGEGGTVTIDYNPGWPITSSMFRLEDRFGNDFEYFAGPWYVNGANGNLTFEETTEELFRLNLPKQVKGNPISNMIKRFRFSRAQDILIVVSFLSLRNSVSKAS